MKNIYTIIVLIVLVAGILFFFGVSKKAEAPLSEIPTSETSAPIIDDNKIDTTNINLSTSVKEFTVTGQNFSFTPSLITVQKGDKVKITFKNTSGFHDFVIDEYDVAIKQTQSPATEVLEFTADKAGVFEYYCSVGTHRSLGMKGILRVE